MSLITNKQQELIDQSVAAYVKNYDKVALQYMATRSEVFAVNLAVQRAIDAKEPVSDSDRLRAFTLQFDLDRDEQAFLHHVLSWGRIIDIKNKFPPHYYQDLDHQYSELLHQQETLQGDIDKMKTVHKPTLSDMAALVRSFDANLSSKRAKRFTKASIQRFVNTPAEDDDRLKQVNAKSLIFTRGELHHSLSDLELAGVDAAGYLDNQLAHGRSFVPLGEDRYFYDVSRSLTPAGSTIDDYDRMIHDVAAEITELVAHGAAAKERWSENARRLEAVQQVLHNGID